MTIVQFAFLALFVLAYAAIAMILVVSVSKRLFNRRESSSNREDSGNQSRTEIAAGRTPFEYKESLEDCPQARCESRAPSHRLGIPVPVSGAIMPIRAKQ